MVSLRDKHAHSGTPKTMFVVSALITMEDMQMLIANVTFLKVLPMGGSLSWTSAKVPATMLIKI